MAHAQVTILIRLFSTLQWRATSSGRTGPRSLTSRPLRVRPTRFTCRRVLCLTYCHKHDRGTPPPHPRQDSSPWRDGAYHSHAYLSLHARLPCFRPSFFCSNGHPRVPRCRCSRNQVRGRREPDAEFERDGFPYEGDIWQGTQSVLALHSCIPARAEFDCR